MIESVTTAETTTSRTTYADDGWWRLPVAVICLVVGTAAACLMYLEGAFRWHDLWVGPTSVVAEELDQEKAVATACLVWGCTLAWCAVVLRRGVSAGVLLTVGLFVTLGAAVDRHQVASELGAISAPQAMWQERADATLDDVGLPEGYERIARFESLVGSAEFPDQWRVTIYAEPVNGVDDRAAVLAFVEESAGPVEACNSFGRWWERSYVLSDDRRLVVREFDDEARIHVSIRPSDATASWNDSCSTL